MPSDEPPGALPRLMKTAVIVIVLVLAVVLVLAWVLGGQDHLPFEYEGFDK